MQSRAATVEDYLASLPPDRREALQAIRAVIKKNIDPAFEEGMQYGMLGYYLPHSRYPQGYHCDPKQPLPFASVASQKNHIGLYLFCVYCDAAEQARFVEEWKASGKKLDMGKSCVRVKKLEDIPLDVLGKTFKRVKAKAFVAAYEAGLAGTAAGAKRAKTATKKVAKKASASKKVATKKAAATRAAKPATRAATKAKPAKKAARRAKA
ncbi:MAG: DUF1801 domain-containing protein [Planctomycetes bacterium]|nr:DUF1801 domain-containing protein [Planctomycetota bacterium]